MNYSCQAPQPIAGLAYWVVQKPRRERRVLTRASPPGFPKCLHCIKYQNQREKERCTPSSVLAVDHYAQTDALVCHRDVGHHHCKMEKATMISFPQYAETVHTTRGIL